MYIYFDFFSILLKRLKKLHDKFNLISSILTEINIINI